MLAVGTHEEFLNDLTVHFLDEKRKPKELRLHEVAPLDAKFRAEIGDCKTASPDIFRYGPPVARPDNARFPPPEVKTRIPFKKKKQSMNI